MQRQEGRRGEEEGLVSPPGRRRGGLCRRRRRRRKGGGENGKVFVLKVSGWSDIRGRKMSFLSWRERDAKFIIEFQLLNCILYHFLYLSIYLFILSVYISTVRMNSQYMHIIHVTGVIG